MPTELRLLFIEDSEDDVAVVLREIERAGYHTFHRRVDTAAALHTALDETEWDLILSDFSMPSFDGSQAFEIYRAKTPDVPFLFLSGQISQDQAIDAMRRGARDFILKDDPSRLIPAIQRELSQSELRRMERAASLALLESERKYRALVEGSLQGTMIVQKGLIVYANPANARMFGYAAPEEMVGLVAIEIVHPDDRHQALQTGNPELLSGDAKLYPYYRGIRKDGSVLWYEAHATPTPWQGRSAIQWSMVEVTERVRAEQALKESQRLLKTVFDALPLHLVVKDKDTRYLMVNPAWCERYGLTPEQVIGKPSMEIPGRPLKDRENTLDQDRKTIAADSKTISFEGWDRTATGEVRHYRSVRAPIRDESGAVIGLVGATMDLTEHKQTEAKLRASETLLQTVFDAIPHSVTVKDVQGRYIMVNKALCNFYGVTSEEILGKNGWDFPPRPAEERARVIEEDRRILEHPGENFGSVGRYTGAGGRPLAVHSFRRALLDADGAVSGIVAIHVDISELKQIEEQLRSGQRLLETVINTIPHVVMVKDLEGRYLVVNQAWSETYGYLPEHVIGRHTSVVASRPANQNQRFLDEDKFVLANGGQVFQDERLYPIKNGGQRYFKAIKAPLRGESGDIIGIVGAYVDLTTEREARAQADTAHARLFDAIECVPGAFFMYDKDHRLVMWNSRVRSFYPDLYKTIQAGTPYRDILRVKAEALVRDARHRTEAWIEEQFRAFATGGGEVEFQLSDGRWVHGYNSRTSDGGTVCLRFDVTAIKRQESELHQSQKMEALGQLTGGVAHDFNNLLQVITSYTRFALEENGDGDKRHNDLRTVLDAGRRAADLTQQLLAFSRKRVMKKQRVDLREIAGGMAKMLGRVLPENIQLAVSDESVPGEVLADRGMAEQAIMNLAVNARDAMPAGGKLSVETASATLDAGFCRTRPWARPGHYVVTRVKDTGTGMTADVRDRIFEPFFTTKAPGKGTGLGLSTVFGVVQQHQALISVDSEPGHGTVFSIYWPALETVEPASVDHARDPVAGGRETILVAEDEDWVRGVTVRTLERAGYKVLPVRDGQEALTVFAANCDMIDLVLLDMMMPKVNGMMCYQQMRETRPGLRAVFCSGWYDEQEEAALAESGAAIVHKPHSPEELLRAVRAKLDSEPSPVEPIGSTGGAPA